MLPAKNSTFVIVVPAAGVTVGVSVKLPGAAIVEGVAASVIVGGVPEGFTVRVAEALDAPSVAVKVTGVAADTETVVAVNVAVVLPGPNATEVGTETIAALLEASVTESPPGGAGALSVTVSVCGEPPVTAGVAGVTDTIVGRLPGAVAVAVIRN